MLKLDFADIAYHALAAWGAMTLGTIFGFPVYAAFAVTLLAVAREAYQAHKRGESISPASWSLQKHLEWGVVPAVAVAHLLGLSLYVESLS